MEAKLVVLTGSNKSAALKLKVPGVIGRSSEADVRIAHPLMSRKHIDVKQKNGTLIIQDLGSLNGTLINNKKIDGPTELPPGAHITFGGITFKAVYGEMPKEVNSKKESTKTATANLAAVAAETIAVEPDSATKEDDAFDFLDELGIETPKAEDNAPNIDIEATQADETVRTDESSDVADQSDDEVTDSADDEFDFLMDTELSDSKDSSNELAEPSEAIAADDNGKDNGKDNFDIDFNLDVDDSADTPAADTPVEIKEESDSAPQADLETQVEESTMSLEETVKTEVAEDFNLDEMLAEKVEETSGSDQLKFEFSDQESSKSEEESHTEDDFLDFLSDDVETTEAPAIETDSAATSKADAEQDNTEAAAEEVSAEIIDVEEIVADQVNDQADLQEAISTETLADDSTIEAELIDDSEISDLLDDSADGESTDTTTEENQEEAAEKTADSSDGEFADLIDTDTSNVSDEEATTEDVSPEPVSEEKKPETETSAETSTEQTPEKTESSSSENGEKTSSEESKSPMDSLQPAGVAPADENAMDFFSNLESSDENTTVEGDDEELNDFFKGFN